jgi:cytochrome c oxidase subunit 2
VKKAKQWFASVWLMMFYLGTAQAEYSEKVKELYKKYGFYDSPELNNYQLNLDRGVTTISNDVYGLHMLILWICVLIGIGVFGTMFYSIYHHRKSKGHQAAQFHENTTVEIVWTIIPALILIGMAIPATYLIVDMNKVQDSQMSIKVTGHQWFWEYDYLDNGIHFFSRLDEASEKARQPNSGIDPRTVPHYLLNVDQPLVVPVNTKIKFSFTSVDVIHSWWVPAFGWKMDANPGFINEAWTSVPKVGTYRGQCTELCGKDHAFMPVVVIAMEPADYQIWVKQHTEPQAAAAEPEQWTHEDLVSEGAKVYQKNCSTCHLADGKGIPGNFPAITASPIVTGDIQAQTQLILKGKGMMPAFGKVLNAKELAQVITYTRNALGNKVGDEIQPKEIDALLGKKTATQSEAKAEVKQAEDKSEPAQKPAEVTETKAVHAESPAEKPAAKPAQATKAVAKTAELSLATLVEKGKAIYETNCGSCHGAEGGGLAGMFPALTGSAVVKGDINAQVALMSKGKGMMPAFAELLSAEEFAAIVTYTRNGLGNKVGDSIQPSAIEKLSAAQ